MTLSHGTGPITVTGTQQFVYHLKTANDTYTELEDIEEEEVEEEEAEEEVNEDKEDDEAKIISFRRSRSGAAAKSLKRKVKFLYCIYIALLLGSTPTDYVFLCWPICLLNMNTHNNFAYFLKIYSILKVRRDH